jgi:hypothetical protein
VWENERVRTTSFYLGGGIEKYPGLKVPRQCPLVVLVELVKEKVKRRKVKNV